MLGNPSPLSLEVNMDIREKMELDKIKREERLQQFIKEERARVLARRKANAEKKKQGK